MLLTKILKILRCNSTNLLVPQKHFSNFDILQQQNIFTIFTSNKQTNRKKFIQQNFLKFGKSNFYPPNKSTKLHKKATNNCLLARLLHPKKRSRSCCVTCDIKHNWVRYKKIIPTWGHLSGLTSMLKNRVHPK